MGKRTTELVNTLAIGEDGLCIHLLDGRIVGVVLGNRDGSRIKTLVYAPSDIVVTRVSHHAGDKEATPDETLEALNQWNGIDYVKTGNEVTFADTWQDLFESEEA